METIDERATEILLDGRYRLGPCLGRGGTAAVYRAEDTILGRTVAIKLLGRADDAWSTDERVHNETTVLASLNHPSLVTLYDARLDAGHARYLAIEYVDGPTLASRLAEGPLSGPEAAGLALDLSEALQVVHDAGIIHRDVKPSNVLLAHNAQRESGWIAKLTDFGIAYSLAEARVTSPGIVVGTAAYMAPEQVRGADLTPAVDIYSLGLVLIEALTGEPAFPVMGKVQTALRRLAEAPTVPESLDPRWAALLTRMTRLAAEQRPSAREVTQAVALLSDAPQPVGRRPNLETAASTLLVPIADTEADTQADTGPTERLATTGTPPPTEHRFRRKLRAGAVGAMIAVAAGIIALAGVWAFSPAGGSLDRAASPMSARDVFTPPAAETGQPPVPDPVDSTTNPDADTAVDTGPAPETEPAPGTGTDPGVGPEDTPGNGVTPDHAEKNPNKGPGNNSGNDKGKANDDKKGKP